MILVDETAELPLVKRGKGGGRRARTGGRDAVVRYGGQATKVLVTSAAEKHHRQSSGRLKFETEVVQKPSTVLDFDEGYEITNGGPLEEAYVQPADASRHGRAESGQPGKRIYGPGIRTAPVAEDRKSPLALYQAADALREASLSPQPGDAVHLASLLKRAVAEQADVRPRHAAVALALADALLCTTTPFGNRERRKVLWDGVRLISDTFISTADEMKLLQRMGAAGLERVPPFEDSAVFDLYSRVSGD